LPDFLDFIGIETYYYQGPPGPPLFAPNDRQFIWLCDTLVSFRDDQTLQMTYQVRDFNNQTYNVLADSIYGLGANPVYTARMEQHNFLTTNFPTVANIDYWEFTGWLLTFKPL
jgi:hypothetical protein